MILDLGDGLFLRQATAEDHPALCLICLRTGNAGRDASWREDDPFLMGQIYAVPYQVLEPELAFVVDGQDGVVGTLFGALDTATFNRRLASRWYPALQRRIGDPGPDRTAWRGSDWVRYAIHNPDFVVPDPLTTYPSHGHIDLLPQARGRGIGRRCIGFLERRLTHAGSTGLFLDVHPLNVGAQRFYGSLGYRHVEVATHRQRSTFMAKSFTS